MAKPERGLPKSFDIKMPARPVSLGDYLDEAAVRPAEPPPPPAPAPIEPLPPAAAPPAVVPAAVAPPPPPPPQPVYARQPQQQPPAPQPVAQRKAPSRKQINLTPDTLRMLDELLSDIRHRSAERDVRASEVLHGLVLAAYEARPYLDLSQVQPRGQWGSATAAALPLSLRDALRRAIAATNARAPQR